MSSAASSSSTATDSADSDEPDEPDEPDAAASRQPEKSPLITRDFALLLAIQTAFGFAFASFFLLPKYVVSVLHGTPSQVGYVGALAVLTAVLASPFVGRFLDRGPRRPLILLGCAINVVSAIAFLGVTQLDSYLYAVRALQGVGFTVFFVAAVTMVADLAPAARLGQALGWFGCAALIMNAVATIIAERIAHDFGWHGVFLSAAAAGALALALSFALREPERPRVAAVNADAPTKSWREQIPVLWGALAGGAGFGVMFTFTPPFALSLGDLRVAPLFAGYTASALLVRLAFGTLADRLGRARVGAAALAFYALVVAATAGLQQGWLGAIGLAFGLAHGAFYPSLNALALEGVEHRQRGTVTAAFNGSFNAGVLLVTFCFGQIAQAYGYRSIFLLVAFITATGCPLLYGQIRRKSWLPRPLSE